MGETDLDLLDRYARHDAEDAFAEIVRRHLGLVHSAALRQVRSPQLAEEVAQSTFLKLARHAREFAAGTVVTAWLYQVTRREAIDVVRREARRQAREQIAPRMDAMEDVADWTHIGPLLDEAMHALDEADRSAVLLRYFENRSLREVGDALGTSDDAAQKRVGRALERLRGFFAARGISVGAGGLGAVLSAQAIQAAPPGLAATIATTAVTGAAASAATLLSVSATILAMTTLQKSAVTAVLVAAIGFAIHEALQNARLRALNQRLEERQAPLAGEVQRLGRERDQAVARQASLAEELSKARKNPAELLKLRGEVGALAREQKAAGEKSALSKITSDPASRKAMRDQQKMSMGALYGGFAKRLGIDPGTTEKFNDLLADTVMDDIDLITQALRDGRSQTEVRQIFADADIGLQAKVQALLGDEAVEKYKAHTQNLVSDLTAAQFAGALSGDGPAKQAKQEQIRKVMMEERTTAVQNAGLPADLQLIPMLNFANIASESEGEQNLRLLDSIYASVAARSSSFLSPDELASFQSYRTNAINSSRMALTMNRNLMAPLSK